MFFMQKSVNLSSIRPETVMCFRGAEFILMNEELTTCSRCGRKVPKTIYCIYCGTPLVGMPKPKPDVNKPVETRKVEPQPLRQVQKRAPPPKPRVEVEQDTFDILSQSIKNKLETLAVSDEEIDAETQRQLGHIRKYTIWKIRLCGLLIGDKVSGEVFKRVFDEYVDEIRRYSKVRMEKAAHYRSALDEKRQALNEAKWRHEELQVRASVGELTKQENLTEMTRLSQRINGLTDEVKILKARLDKFENLLDGVNGKELYEFEEIMHRTVDLVESLADAEKITHDTAVRVRENILQDIKMFENESETLGTVKEVKAELEVLEARLKVGEIDDSQYSSERQRLMGLLDDL